MKISKVDQEWEIGETIRGEPWRYRDLSGKHLGVRLEELPPNVTSSEHHFHTAEEEHVIVMEGAGTLFFGSEQHPIRAGDHFWFKAGEEIAHHIKNTSTAHLKFLVFGERLTNDVVVYPEHQVMMLKSIGSKQYAYRSIESK